MMKFTLKQLREDRSYSQRDLADKAGVALITVFRWEHGQKPNSRSRRLIAEALNVNPSDII